MGAIRRRFNRGLAPLLPEKRLFIQSDNSTRFLRLSPLSQLMLGAAGLAFAGWMAVASSALVVGLVEADGRVSQTALLQEAYQARLDELAAERDQRAAEAYSAQNRFSIALEQIGRQQMAILGAVEERRELATALDLMRARLQESAASRASLEAENRTLTEQMGQVSATLAASGHGEDVSNTLDTVAAALADAARARDEAVAERGRLAQSLSSLELRMAINAKRQEEMVAELEQAVSLTMGPLESLFQTTELDVDSLIALVRSTHSGQGGPETPRVSVSTRSFESPGLNSRFDDLMVDLDRVNLLRIAAGRIPYAMPVRTSIRFTSGYGMRRDPKGAGRRMHKGIDLAGPRGTPIHATADGEVVSAGWESGFGKTVRIRHDFGFETIYAHQHKIRVSEGQQVSRGDHIGDMGTTGRSTGVHLHYEVHLNGAPVNPMTYLEAAKNVF